MMEPVAWLTKTRMGNIAWATWQPAGEPLVRLSDAGARIAELERERDVWKAKSGGIAVQPVLDSLHAAEARAEAAEALLKEARKALNRLEAVALKQPIAGGPDNVHLHNDWRGWWNKLFRPAMQEARAIHDKIGVKDE